MTIRILIADDERPARFGLRRALEQRGYEIEEVEEGNAALARLQGPAIDLAFLDLEMPGMDGQEVLRALAGRATAEIIVVTADDRLEMAVECMRLGASDYVTKPYEVERMRTIAARVARVRSLERRVADLEQQLDAHRGFGALIGTSRAMRDVFEHIEKLARASIDILIRGETGTGKELVAREIHRCSDRSGGPFVAVNTSAVPEALAESEWFGHVKGAFTGADQNRDGLFCQADGGTLFLDEVGDMPLPVQTKILRVLQERTVQPVGANKNRAIDVRIICATHQSLEDAIAAGTFRGDLYYRIAGAVLQLPPLRARREDIVILAEHFAARTVASDAGPLRMVPAAIDELIAYAWPGNVRELEQIVRTAAALADDGTVRTFSLKKTSSPSFDFNSLLGLPFADSKAQLVDAFERATIEAALARHEGNISAAARQLGIHRQSLQQKLKQLGLR